MGNLCCCFKKNDFYDDDSNSETRRILDNPVGINDGDCRDDNQQVPSSYGYGGYGSTIANGGRNQSYENSQSQMYNRVLNQLSSRVIDISSIEKSGEQADLTDREHAMNKKLSAVRKTVILESNKPLHITRSDYSNYKSKDPIPIEDYQLITNIATLSSNAVEHGFRIIDSEPFVVTFENANDNA